MLLDKNDFVMTLVLFIHFVSASVWKGNDIFLYFICGLKEMTSFKKIYIIIFGIKE